MVEENKEVATEEWRPVVGYEGKYKVSRSGAVYSITKGILLSPQSGRGGYLRVELWKGNVRQGRSVHSVVAEAFIGPRPPGLHINHIDGNKLNNTPPNLEYITQAENNRHAFRTGLTKHNLKNLTHRHFVAARKLSERDVMEIKDLRGIFSTTEIGRLYGVHNSHVSRLQRGMRRSHKPA